MPGTSNFIFEIICFALSVYWGILFARIILSWVTLVRSLPQGIMPVVRIIYDLTEPVLSLFRRYIPPMGGFDLSPIFIFLIIAFLQRGIC